MKKAITFICAVVLLVSFLPAAAHASPEMKIDELKLSVTLPDGWIAFGRMVNADDPNLKALGTTKEKQELFYIKNNIYLDVIHPDLIAEMFIMMQETKTSQKTFDYNLISDEELKKGAEDVIKNPPSDQKGYTFTGYEIIQHQQAKFIAYNRYFKDGAKTIYSRQYNTVINGQIINIILNDLKGLPVSKEQEQILRSFVESLAFDEVKKKTGMNWVDAGMIAVIAAIAAGLFLVWKQIMRGKKKRQKIVDEIEAIQLANDKKIAAIKRAREESIDKEE